LNVPVEHAIRRVHVNRLGLKLNGTYQILAYDDGMNILGRNIETIKRNTETLINASKEVGLQVNVEEAKYMLVSEDQNADRI
jgi:hypothetical protein